MKASSNGRGLTVAVHIEIDADVAGGTETAELLLISALGRLQSQDRFVLLGAPSSAHKLVPLAGPNQSVQAWPRKPTWYQLKRENPLPVSPRSRRVEAALGPLGGLLRWGRRFYAPKPPQTPVVVEDLRAKAGALAPLVPLAYRLYRSLRHGVRNTNPWLAEDQSDRLLKRAGASVVHFPSPLHFATRLPFLYEPWALPHKHHPEFLQPGEEKWMEAVYRHGCERAAMVVTSNHWVKQDIIRHYGLRPDKIAVIPRLPRPKPPIPVDLSLPVLPGLPSEFALYPANTFLHKNHAGLLRALARLRDAHGIVLPLVCTGRTDGPVWAAIQAELKTLRLEGQVFFLGPVSREDLHRLYAAAKLLVFPTQFEGLGFPILEAFQYGLPVIASTATCVPEIVGDAGELFDPWSDEAIADALLRVLRAPGRLEDLRRRSAERGRMHSLERMAKMFVACYHHAARMPLDEEERVLFREMTED